MPKGQGVTLLQRICGCSEGAIHWRYGYHDFTKPSHVLAYLFWCLVEKIREDWPHAIKWHLADFFSRIANRLRGNEVLKWDTWGGGLEGNEAAKLADDLNFTLVIELGVDHVLLPESQEKLFRLAQLAKETWWHEKPKDFPGAPGQAEPQRD